MDGVKSCPDICRKLMSFYEVIYIDQKVHFFALHSLCYACGCLCCGKIVFMTNTKYPRLSFRLAPTMKKRLEISSNSRHISQGKIVRDALKKYFINSEYVDEEL